MEEYLVLPEDLLLKLKEIYHFIIQEGIRTDLRRNSVIDQLLLDEKKVYSGLSNAEQKFFDKDNLFNPYSDTRILFGDQESEVKKVLVGIDLETPELLVARELGREEKPFDLAVAHHPEGIALAGLYEVMHMQKNMLSQLGIQEPVVKDLMEKRLEEVSRSLHGSNHSRSVDAAKLLGIPYMCCHTPADNHVTKFLQKMFNQTKPKSLGQVVNQLLREPEYKDAAGQKAGPKILIGKKTDKAGRIVVDMTGGTEGSKDIFARLSQLGVDTLVGMHLSEAHYQKIRSEHINVIIAGHMASDNLGMNLLFDKLERRDKLDIVACSGFRRFRR